MWKWRCSSWIVSHQPSFHPSLALQMYPDVLIFYFSGKSHMKIGNHNYFLSWREPWHKFEVIWHWHLTIWNKAYQSGKNEEKKHSDLNTQSNSIKFCRTGIGSTDVISAGTAAWTLCPLTHLASSRCSRRSWQEVRQRRQICINFCSNQLVQTYPPVRGRNPRVVFKVADDGCSRAV